MIKALYSYRRCPYAIRARMALRYSQISVEIREISLRLKPPSLLTISPKGTVPVLLYDDLVIEQSLEIMKWAIAINDPDAWYSKESESEIDNLININDGPFKKLLDSFKYQERSLDRNDLKKTEAVTAAVELLIQPLNLRLANSKFLLGDRITLADVAIFPFIRQFSMVDETWFINSEFHDLNKWLKYHLESPMFKDVMQKYPTWSDLPQEKK